MSPQISILLPVYNGEKYLSIAMESVLAQTFDDFELIVVDDCSTDRSKDIIRQIASKDKRVRVFNNAENKGLFANYNRCLELAKGQYIKPFAQDDSLSPNALARMFEVLEADKTIALVSCARDLLDADGGLIETKAPFPDNRRVRGREVILYNLLSLSNWVGEPSTVMYRRSAEQGGFDTELFHAGDLEMWFRILLNGDYFYINETLATFRRHAEGATSKNLVGLLFALDTIRLGKLYRSILENFGETEEHYALRVAEVAALHLDHLVRNQGATVEKAISSARDAAKITSRLDDAALAQKMMNAFVELSYISLRYITHSVTELDATKSRLTADNEFLKRQIEDMHNSTSWRLTKPLRMVMGQVKN